MNDYLFFELQKMTQDETNIRLKDYPYPSKDLKKAIYKTVCNEIILYLKKEIFLK